MSRIKEEYEDDFELLYLVSESSEEADEAIFKKYAPVINYYSKKYASLVIGKGIDENDLYQEGLIGLNQAINSYKNQKNIKFSTFAFTCIKRKMLTAIKIANRKKHSILNDSYSLDYKFDEDADSFDNSIMVNSGLEDLLVSKENDAYYKNRLDKELSSFEKEVYELKLSNFSNEEIANVLSKSYKSIESALNRIRIKLRTILKEID